MALKTTFVFYGVCFGVGCFCMPAWYGDDGHLTTDPVAAQPMLHNDGRVMRPGKLLVTRSKAGVGSVSGSGCTALGYVHMKCNAFCSAGVRWCRVGWCRVAQLHCAGCCVWQAQTLVSLSAQLLRGGAGEGPDSPPQPQEALALLERLMALAPPAKNANTPLTSALTISDKQLALALVKAIPSAYSGAQAADGLVEQGCFVAAAVRMDQALLAQRIADLCFAVRPSALACCKCDHAS
eukprot:COSAG01_NODE_3913_length_5545_cov_4.588505_3_plen_237_part_00